MMKLENLKRGRHGGIRATIGNRHIFIPEDPANRHYARILAEKIPIADADPEPASAPREVSRARLVYVLNKTTNPATGNKYMADLETAAARLAAAQRERIELVLADEPTIRRDGRFAAFMQSVLGLDGAGVDALFTTAAELEL